MTTYHTEVIVVGEVEKSTDRLVQKLQNLGYENVFSTLRSQFSEVGLITDKMIIFDQSIELEDQLQLLELCVGQQPGAIIFCELTHLDSATAKVVLASGAADYLIAPVTETELAIRMETHLLCRALELKFRAAVTAETELALERRLSDSLKTSNQDLKYQVQKRTVELRKLAAELESGTLRERERIRRDFHDDMGPVLSCLRLELDLIETSIATGDDPSGNLESSQEFVDKIFNTHQRIVAGLRPAQIDEGLQAAIEILLAETSTRFGIEIFHELSEQLDELDSVAAQEVYRCIQEAINNIIKHSSATQFSVLASASDYALLIEIADSGIGFDLDEISSGFGMISMRERIESISGEFKLDSKRGQGTTLSIRLPLV